MSEQAKLVYLQERIKQAKREERYGNLMLFVGFVFIASYLILPQISASVEYSPFILILGIISALYGALQISYYNRKYTSLKRELANASKNPNMSQTRQPDTAK